MKQVAAKVSGGWAGGWAGVDWGPVVCRALWAVLLLIHIPVLAAVTSRAGEAHWSGSEAARVLVVLGCIAFFITKLIRPRFLSLPTRRGSLVVFLLVCALAHPPDSGEAGSWQLPAVLATGALAVDEGRRRLPSIRKLLDSLRADFGERMIAAPPCVAFAAARPSFQHDAYRRAAPPRAPPR